MRKRKYVKIFLKELGRLTKDDPDGYINLDNIINNIGENNKALVKRAIKYMESEGYITIEDSEDNTYRVVYITAKGDSFSEWNSIDSFMNLPLHRKIEWVVGIVVFLFGSGILFNYCDDKKEQKNNNNPTAVDNSKNQNTNNSPGSVQIDGDNNEVTISTKNKKISEKVIKGKIDLLIETADNSKATTPYLSIDEIARRGEIEIRGSIEQAYRQGGPSSGLIQAFSRDKYEELIRNLDGRMDILKSDVFKELSDIDQTKLEEIPYLADENGKYKKLLQRVENIKIDIKNRFNIKELK